MNGNLIYIKNIGFVFHSGEDDSIRFSPIPLQVYVLKEEKEKQLKILTKLCGNKEYKDLVKYIKIKYSNSKGIIQNEDNTQYNFKDVIQIVFQIPPFSLLTKRKTLFSMFLRELDKNNIKTFHTFSFNIGLPMGLQKESFKIPVSYQFIDIEVYQKELLKSQNIVKDLNDEIVSIQMKIVTENTSHYFLILNLNNEIQKNEYIKLFNTTEQYDYESSSKTIVKILPVKNEKQLLITFFELLKKFNVNMILGWFQKTFDFPYLYKRMSMYKYFFTLYDYWNTKFIRGNPKEIKQIEEIIKQVPFLNVYNDQIFSFLDLIDYRDLYEKYVTQEPQGWQLDIIAKNDGIKGKTIQKGFMCYPNDLQKFIEYAIRDIEILSQLEEKHKLVSLVYSLKEIIPIQYKYIYNNTHMIMQMMYYCLQTYSNMNIVFPSKNFNPQNIQYEGAYVMNPENKRYKNVVVFDFQSLYPNIIRTFNISCETLFYIKEDEIKENENNNQLKYVDIGNILKINDAKVCFRLNNNEQQILPTIVQDILDKRNKFKKIYKETKSEDQYNKQLAYKILANSIYGQFGYFNFPLFNYVIQSQITAIQRYLITNVMNHINKISIDNFNFHQVYGDTDSVFIHITDKNNREINVSESELIEIQTKLKNKLNSEIIPEIIKPLFVNVESITTNTLQMDIDKIFKYIKFFGVKKRYYGLNFQDNEVYKGIELQRSDTPPYQKEQIKEIFKEMLVSQQTEEDIIKYYYNIDNVLETDLLQLQQPKNIRIQNIEELNQYKVVPFHLRGFLLGREILTSLQKIRELLDKVYIFPIIIKRSHPKIQEIKKQLIKYKVQYEENKLGDISCNIAIINEQEVTEEFIDQIKKNLIEFDKETFFEKQILNKIEQFSEYLIIIENIKQKIQLFRSERMMSEIYNKMGTLFQIK